MEEIWRPCPGFEATYKISSLGRVCRQAGTLGPGRGERLLKPWLNTSRSGKYLYVSLRKRGTTTKIGVHVLICHAWHGAKPSEKHQVAHWDGNSMHNVPTNVRWAIRRHNELDKKRHGRWKHGPTKKTYV